MKRIFIFCFCLTCVQGVWLDARGSSQDETLPEIEVREPQDNTVINSFSGIKANALTRDLPLSIEVLNNEALQQSQQLELMLDENSLSNMSPTDGGLFAEIILRGFSDASFYRNGLNHSLGTQPFRELANVESVEILKGPGSALYGPGEPGGTINFITKKPLFEPMHVLKLGYGSYERFRAEFDSTGPLSESDEFAYRLVGAYENTNSFRDTVDTKRVFAAPSISWHPGNNWKLLGEVEFIQHKTPFDSGLIAVDDEFPLPQSRWLGEPAIDPTRLESLTTTFSAEYEPGDSWSISAKILWQDTDIDGLRVEPDELDESSLIRELQNERDKSENFAAQLELSRKLDWGKLSHQLLFGYEFTSIDNDVRLSGSDTDDDPFAIDVFNPVYGQNKPAIEQLRESTELLDQHSLYVQNFLRFGKHWRLLLGLRLDNFDIEVRDLLAVNNFNQSETELSFRVGIVYSPTSTLSLFAGYNESTDPNEGLTPDGSPLKPTQADSVEAGIKIRYPAGNLSLDLSAFRIEQTNVASEAPDAPGFEIQTARQLSKGLDLDLSYKPTPWLLTGLKYAYTDVRILDDLIIPKGTRPLNVPEHKLVLSGLLTSSVKREHDLKAGLSFVYKSSQQASLDTDELDISLPGYWTGNLFIDYQLSTRVSLGVNISNILDENYLSGSQSDILHIHPGPPVSIMGNLSIRF